MTVNPAFPAVPRSAATLILLRDGSRGPETLMIQRHAAMSFAPGALVFPGGCLAETDSILASGDGGLAQRIAAIRETFEECGILLVRERHNRSMIPAARSADLAARYRSALSREEIGFDTMLTAEELVPATDLLVPYGQWVTPETRPKRFDTLFFLAPCPADRAVDPDGAEAVSCIWDRPADILRAADIGSVRLIFATRMNLLRLVRSGSVADALAEAARQPLVRVVPTLVETPCGPFMRIPSDAGYAPCSVPAELVDLA